MQWLLSLYLVGAAWAIYTLNNTSTYFFYWGIITLNKYFPVFSLSNLHL